MDDPVNASQLLLDSPVFGAAELAELQRAVATNPRDVRTACTSLRARVDSDGSDRDITALGIASHLLSDHESANTWLSRVSGNGWADIYRGHSLMALERFDAAAQAYLDAAADSSVDSIQASLLRAGAIRLAGRIDEAEALIRENARTAVTRADYSYQMGCILSDRGDTFGAIEYFERAGDMDPHHSGALFRLAALNASFGNDDEAVKLYERALSKPPYYLGALINLGLLYEDSERYDAAAFCFRRVLEFDPTHLRARLYLKDIEASGEMFYDEDAVRREREAEQVLSTSLADFELSARSRNCLERLGLDSLGDLTAITEAELMASKNFGETSLKEVRTILESRGLVVGQNVEEKRTTPSKLRREDLSDEQRAIFDNPISDLNLSVRARKCVSRLGLASIGELLNRTPDDLLSVRNFGVTSLNEIRQQLAEMGVSLRND